MTANNEIRELTDLAKLGNSPKHAVSAALVSTAGAKPEPSSAMLSAIVDFSRDAVISKNLDGTITGWNRGAENLFGYRVDEIGGRSIIWLIPPELWHEESAILEALRSNHTIANLETVRVAKDGRRIPVCVTISPLLSQSGEIVGATDITRDISSRVVERESLQAFKSHFLMLAQKSPVGIFETNSKGECLFVNEYWNAIFGISMSQATGLGWLEAIHPEDRERVWAAWTTGIRAGAEFVCIYRNCGPENDIRWVVSTAKPIANPCGDPVCCLGTVLDIMELERRLVSEATGKHEKCFQTMSEALSRSHSDLESLVAERTAELHEKIDELHHISYAMVHDMRAPLRALHGFAELLQEESAGGASAQGQEYPRRIKIAAERFDTLVTEALNYTKVVEQGLPLAPMRLDRLINDLTQTYPNLLPERAEIVIVGPLPAVLGNESYLTQCFSILLDNAVKFVPPGVRPKVRIWSEDAKPHSSGQKRVRIWVEDNGIGICQDVRHRLFGLFQKLNTSHEGSGVGLAIARKVVERMGGRIGVESEEGKGSRFWVDLLCTD